MTKVIAICGTHGTGKTTLSYKLAAAYKGLGKSVKIIQEVARSCPFPLNDKMTKETALWIYYEHARKELEAKRNNDVVICDRTIFDSFVYAKHARIDEIDEQHNQAINHTKSNYDQILFVRPDIPISVDSVRSPDLHFQKRIDELFDHYMIEVPCTQIKSSQIFDERFNWKQYCL